jgi:nicotinate phosphoribosyltransferase
MWGIGTKLITSYTSPALGGVYKMSAIEQDGKLVPKIKISNTFEKITNPGLKKFIRIYNGETHMAEADLIMLFDEQINTNEPLTIFHPEQTWKETTFTNYYIKDMMVKVIEKGKCIYEKPSLKEIMSYAKESMAEFSEEYKRIDNPHIFKVDLSKNLFDLKRKLLTVNK